MPTFTKKRLYIYVYMLVDFNNLAVDLDFAIEKNSFHLKND